MPFYISTPTLHSNPNLCCRSFNLLCPFLTKGKIYFSPSKQTSSTIPVKYFHARRHKNHLRTTHIGQREGKKEIHTSVTRIDMDMASIHLKTVSFSPALNRGIFQFTSFRRTTALVSRVVPEVLYV